MDIALQPDSPNLPYLNLTDEERAAALYAMATQSKKWRRSIAGMKRDGRDGEMTALSDRLAHLTVARRKLGATIDEEEG